VPAPALTLVTVTGPLEPVAKVTDIVGLYLAPPENAVVLA
jgi:hypothetical protein